MSYHNNILIPHHFKFQLRAFRHAHHVMFEVMFQISAVIVIVLFLFDIALAKLSAIFIFGDSLVDVGNNNYINTLAKSSFPNGIDFCKEGSSGRFTNGRTVTDILEQDLGAKNFTAPYLAPTTTNDTVLKGVNYASSGSGILNTTGNVWGGRINLDEQISNFEQTKNTIVSRIGRREARRLLKHQSLFIVVTGANDFFFEQQMLCSQNQSSQEAYLNDLMSTFKSQLTRLYYLEARRIIVSNIPKLGCSPYERDQNPEVKGCVSSLNQPIKSYNSRLKHLLEDLTTNLTDSTYVYADIYAISKDILHNYRTYGFENADSACCHTAGAHGGLIPCFTLSEICSDRTKYVFWDAFHMTESSNMIAAKHMMDGGTKYMSPMNIRQLVHSKRNESK